MQVDECGNPIVRVQCLLQNICVNKIWKCACMVSYQLINQLFFTDGRLSSGATTQRFIALTLENECLSDILPLCQEKGLYVLGTCGYDTPSSFFMRRLNMAIFEAKHIFSYCFENIPLAVCNAWNRKYKSLSNHSPALKPDKFETKWAKVILKDGFRTKNKSRKPQLSYLFQNTKNPTNKSVLLNLFGIAYLQRNFCHRM